MAKLAAPPAAARATSNTKCSIITHKRRNTAGAERVLMWPDRNGQVFLKGRRTPLGACSSGGKVR